MEFGSGISSATVFMAIGSLLILSLLTIRKCRSDKSKPALESTFLFSGKNLIHSLASSAGAIFSVTYFLGAPMIYAKVYGYWLLLIMFFVALVSILALLSILTKIESTTLLNKRNLRSSNVMIDYIRRNTNPKQFKIYIHTLLIIYCALLVEELSISRMVLEQIFSSNELIATIILGIIIFIAYFYIYFGGFKAVLNSDLVQTIILNLFMFVLIVLSKNNSKAIIAIVPTSNLDFKWLTFSIILWSIFGIVWLIGSVDFYSRLNFVSRKLVSNKSRRIYVVVSIVSVCIVSLSAIYFSNNVLNNRVIQSPEVFYNEIVNYFINTNTPIIAPLFLVAIFCMIFTTIDTLLITNLQISSFLNSKEGDIRSRISTILVICVIFSSIVPKNMVCAGGIFVGSLLIIPVSTFLNKIYNISNLFPKSMNYLFVSMIISILIFIKYYKQLENHFDLQFLIPGIVSLSTLISVFFFKIYEKWRGSNVSS